MQDHHSPVYLTELQVAEMTGVSVSTLQNHRHYCKGLPYIKFGKSVRYDKADVIAYMESRKINPLG